MKRLTSIFLALMLVLGMVQVGYAEVTSFQIPNESYFQEGHITAAGDFLYAVGETGTYRVSLTTGIAERIGEGMQDYGSQLTIGAQGTLYLDALESNWPDWKLVRQQMNAQGEWETVRETPLSQKTNVEVTTTQAVAATDDTVCVLFHDMSGGMQLIRWNVAEDTVAVNELPDVTSWSPYLCIRNGRVNIFSDENDGLLMVSCDLANGKPTNEKISKSKLPDGWMEKMAWNEESGKFAAAYMNNETALFVGESLDSMQQLIGNLPTNSFVMTANDILLMNGTRLISSAVFTQPKAELTIANFDVGNTDYTFDTGVVLHQAAWNVNIEDQMNTRSPDVDIFNITYSEIGSLIRKGFFVDLSSSSILMDRANNLYPAFRNAAITEDGKLIGLFTYAFFSNSLTTSSSDEYTTEVLTKALARYGVTTMPETIQQLCETIQMLEEEEFLDDPDLLFLMQDIRLMGYPYYKQSGLVDMALVQYFNEQTAQGKKINLDDPALKALLQYILTNVPKETAEDPWYFNGIDLFSTNVNWINEPIHLSLKVGEDSPTGLDMGANIMIVNPFSKNQAEAIRFLEYEAQNMDDNDRYIFYADQTEPLEDKYTVQRLADEKEQLAALEAMEQTDDVKQQIESLRWQIEADEANRYTYSPEDIAQWQSLAPSIRLCSETFFTDDFRQLVDRLLDGQLTLDEFIQRGNQYFQMLYQERGE